MILCWSIVPRVYLCKLGGGSKEESRMRRENYICGDLLWAFKAECR